MGSFASIELVPVVLGERSALYELVDEYLAELSAHRELPVGPANAHSYEYLPLYWEEAGRHPFFLCSRGQRVGFALIREVRGADTMEMSEFFIRPHARRAGLGRLAVTEIWRRFPGSWELQFHPLNRAASVFWRRCIEQLSTGVVRTVEVRERDGSRVQYNFEIAAA